jgi:class 3 adenylate cyclase/tetratricopeptide (TPR) repeat protein
VTLEAGTRLATLSSYVPQAVLQDVASPLPDRGEAHAERFAAAILLIDITGFTALTASAVALGPAGTEGLSRSINAYLGQIIEVIHAHGGDIAKIVGDALMPVWPVGEEDLATVARRAALCGLEIATELGEVEVEGDARLSLKVGLCAGEVAATHVGGLDGRWLFLLAGEAMAQLSSVEAQMQTGTLTASPEAWALVSSRFVGQRLERGHVRVRTTEQQLAPRPLRPIELAPDREAAIRAYIPPVSLGRLDAGQADWLAELRRTTVVFANIRGVGSAREDAVELLQRITLMAQRVFGRYDGWLKELTVDDKGMTLVAAFGVPPFTHENDPARAVQAALTVQSEIRALGLTAGVGVATGPAFCGPFGNRLRRDFAVLGQHVNLAARLMQASGDEGILVDAETQQAAGGRQTFDRLPAYVLKGMAGPIDVYRVRATEPGTDGASGMINRVREQATATETLELLKAGVGALVVFEGEPGIGKSRLVGAWVRRAGASGVATVVGSAAEIDSATPYHAWRSIFEQLLGLETVTDRASRRATVLATLGADGADDRSVELAPLLDPVLSLDLPDNETTNQLGGAVRADNTRDLLVRLLRNGAPTPLMVVLEDAHWLDSASWSLLFRVRRELPSILVVVTMRPIGGEQADPVGPMRSDATTLHLDPLSSDDGIALACERTGAARLAEPVAAFVNSRAEGNPLFIEQLTYAMRDTGRIVVENGVCRVAGAGEELASSIIPDTVQRVITSRLDQLPPAEAMTLKVASVIGQKFALRTLTDIYPLSVEASALIAHLDTLTRLDLVAPTPLAPEPAYEFRHVITQEVAYNLMLSAQSQELHRKLADWYERTYAEDLSPFHAFLAHHWGKAGLATRAVDHLEAAGEQALRTFANEEAIGFLEAAMTLAAQSAIELEPARQARWRLQLGEAYVHMSRYHEGREHLEAGLRLMKRPVPHSRFQQGISLLRELVRQLLRRAGLRRGPRQPSDAAQDDLIAVFRAYERLAEASYYGRETLLPLYCVIRILNEAEASGIPAEIARGYAGTGALFGVVPMPRVAEWYLQRALDRLAETDDVTTREIVEIVAGFYYIGAARWDLAREHFRSVRRLARRLGDRRRLDDALANLAELEYLQGAFRSAAALSDELATSALDRNDRRFHAEGLAGRAYSSWQLGEAAEASRSLASLRKVIAEERDLVDELQIKAAGIEAQLQLSRGDTQQALRASEEAMRLTAGKRPTSFATFLGYVGPAEVYLSLWETGREPREGQALASEAVARLRRFAAVFPIGRPRAALLEGRRLWLLGRRDAGLRAWQDALAGAGELSMAFEEGLCHLEIGRHLDAGDAARVTHIQAARELFGRLGANRALAAIEDAG